MGASDSMIASNFATHGRDMLDSKTLGEKTAVLVLEKGLGMEFLDVSYTPVCHRFVPKKASLPQHLNRYSCCGTKQHEASTRMAGTSL